MPLNKRSKMKRTIIFIIIIYAVLVGIIIILTEIAKTQVKEFFDGKTGDPMDVPF